MALSEITITFNEDLVATESVSVGINRLGTPVLRTWDWVANRVLSYQVTEGTPTATAGETSAANFASAFGLDLNNPVEFTILATSNVVTITATDSKNTFLNGSSAKDVDFVIGNSGGTSLSTINVSSPYFITAPINDGSQNIDPTEVDFELKIWSGDIVTDKPAAPNYSYNKKPLFLTDKAIYITADKQVKDFINHSYNGTLSSDCVYLNYDVTTKYIDVTELELNDVNNVIAFDGYGLISDGVNPTFEDLMINNRHISILQGENINIPFYKGGSDYTIYSRTGTTVLNTYNITALDIDNTSLAVEYLTINSDGVNNIRIVNDDTSNEVIISVEVVTECTYAPIKCTFVNRRGVQQEFYFFKSNKESAKFTNESYKESTVSADVVGNSVVISYNANKHTNKTYNKQGSKSINLNSGYIDEDNNILIDELLMSEHVWLTIDNTVYPVDVDTKSIEYLTRLNDQLIKYAIKFNYSLDIKQNIR